MLFQIDVRVWRDVKDPIHVLIPHWVDVPDGHGAFPGMLFTPRATTNAQGLTKSATESPVCVYHVVTATGPIGYVNFDPFQERCMRHLFVRNGIVPPTQLPQEREEFGFAEAATNVSHGTPNGIHQQLWVTAAEPQTHQHNQQPHGGAASIEMSLHPPECFVFF